MPFIRFHLASRCLALLLLLFAATDLLYSAACADGPTVLTAQVTVCAGDHAPDAGHEGDDCFCCSRTVRAEVATALVAVDLVSDLPDDRALLLVFAPARLPFHPPLA